MAQELIALVPLGEDPGLFPTSTSWLTTTCNFSSRGVNALFWPPRAPGIQCRTLVHIWIKLLYTVLVRVSIPGIKHHDQKQLGEEKIYFSLYLHLTVHWEESQGRNPEVGTKPELREDHCLLVCSPWLAQFAFLAPRTTRLGVSPPTMG